MQKLTKFYLVRHGESLANHDNAVGGHLDSPLTKKGILQAFDTKKILDKVKFDDAYSSDLQRAVMTGDIIYGKEISPDHKLFALRERTFGKLEGHSADKWEALNQQYEKKYRNLPFEQRWDKDYADYIENDKSLCQRFEKALRKIAKSDQGKTVLIATHGGNIRVILMKLGFSDYLGAGTFANAGYVSLTFDGKDFQVKKVVGIKAPSGV